MDITISSWVRPNGGPDSNEIIVGRVLALPRHDPSDVVVGWLSNERGLWVNHEYFGDLAVIPEPALGVIEAILVSAVPTTPWGYEA